MSVAAAAIRCGELLRARRADPRAGLEVERDRPERRPVDRVRSRSRARGQELSGGEVDRTRRLEADDRVGAARREVAERDRLRAHDPHAVGERRELREPVEHERGPGRLDREELDVVLRRAR